MAHGNRFGVVHDRVEAESARFLQTSALAYEAKSKPDPSLSPNRHHHHEKHSRQRQSSPSRRSSIVADSVVEGWRITRFLTQMTAKLITYVAFSCWAYVMFTRLCLFALILLPAFLTIVWKYFTSANVRRDFYGQERRQSLDIYLSSARPDSYNKNKKRPVIIFFSGGAWIIGYKAWGALMGFCYSRLGYVFVTPDYRNFPQANIDEIMGDVDLAIDWCIKNIEKYGGDDQKIVLMGQSAGAHLASLALLSGLGRKNKLETHVKESCKPSWSLENIRGLISISGPYNLTTLVPYLDKRGLNTVLLSTLFRNEYDSYSPVSFAKSLKKEHGSNLSCGVPIVIIHGTADVTVPYEQSEEFYQTLKETVDDSTCDLSLVLLPNLTHTDPIIELPMKGKDPLMERTLEHLRTMVGEENQGSARSLVSPMLPESVINLARFVNPF